MTLFYFFFSKIRLSKAAQNVKSNPKYDCIPSFTIVVIVGNQHTDNLPKKGEKSNSEPKCASSKACVISSQQGCITVGMEDPLRIANLRLSVDVADHGLLARTCILGCGVQKQCSEPS